MSHQSSTKKNTKKRRGRQKDSKKAELKKKNGNKSPFKSTYISPDEEWELKSTNNALYQQFHNARTLIYQQYRTKSESIRQQSTLKPRAQTKLMVKRAQIDAKIQEKKLYLTYLSMCKPQPNSWMLSNSALALNPFVQQMTSQQQTQFYSQPLSLQNNKENVNTNNANNDTANANNESSGKNKKAILKKPRRVKKPKFSEFNVRVLRDWYETHPENPYPSSIEKNLMGELTGLTKYQVSRWFCNVRARKPRPPESSSEEEEVTADLMLAEMQTLTAAAMAAVQQHCNAVAGQPQQHPHPQQQMQQHQQQFMNSMNMNNMNMNNPMQAMNGAMPMMNPYGYARSASPYYPGIAAAAHSANASMATGSLPPAIHYPHPHHHNNVYLQQLQQQQQQQQLSLHMQLQQLSLQHQQQQHQQHQQQQQQQHQQQHQHLQQQQQQGYPAHPAYTNNQQQESAENSNSNSNANANANANNPNIDHILHHNESHHNTNNIDTYAPEMIGLPPMSTNNVMASEPSTPNGNVQAYHLLDEHHHQHEQQTMPTIQSISDVNIDDKGPLLALLMDI